MRAIASTLLCAALLTPSSGSAQAPIRPDSPIAGVQCQTEPLIPQRDAGGWIDKDARRRVTPSRHLNHTLAPLGIRVDYKNLPVRP